MKDGEVEYKKTEELALKQKCRRCPSFSSAAPTEKMLFFGLINQLLTDSQIVLV